MISFLLENTLKDYLTSPIKIVGLVIAILGLAVCMLAKKITMVKRGTDQIEKNDPLYVTTLAIGLCITLVGLITTIF